MARTPHNLENLRPCSNKEEASERGRKGGLASAEARKKQKALKELLENILEGKPNEATINKLKAAGIKDNRDMTNKAVLAYSIFGQALKGNSKAIDTVTGLLQEGKEYELRIKEQELKIKNLEADLKTKETELKAIQEAYASTENKEIHNSALELLTALKERAGALIDGDDTTKR